MATWFDPDVCWKCNSYIDVRGCSICREKFCSNHRKGHEKLCWSKEQNAVNYNGVGPLEGFKLIRGGKRAERHIPKDKS